MITYGFYNSIDGDRKYNASHLGKLFDGVISDGIFGTLLNKFTVTVTNPESMSVNVDTGKAWLQGTWTINDQIEIVGPFDIVSTDGYNRIDAIVITVNKDNGRENVLEIVKGTAAYGNSAARPTLSDNQFPIAYVTIHGHSDEDLRKIAQTDITYVVGQTRSEGGTPLVTGSTTSYSISAITAKWEAAFEIWFNEIQGQITEDAAINLQNQINSLIQYGTTPCPATLPDGKVYFQYERTS